jgi:hypothetical protein
MTTLTITKAKRLAAEIIHGTSVKSKVTETVKVAYIQTINGTSDDKALVALWEICATDKPTLAVIRSIFNRVTKAVHKELDIDKPAMCVKDGQLVEVQKRGGKGGGSEGGEGGEGEHTLNAEGEAVPTREQNRELMAHLKILAELHDKSNDVAARSALKFAIANLV